ncbi:MAG: type II CRISPR RNA-guided endonuclease Cas9 [Bacteroidales bacterium]|nr:type II CRISPR RNA-guided endonuclease Cas9 [Bacteroidales bacterium]
MAKVLGLDLGTNSIGWAVVDNEQQQILHAGSRIIPMDEGMMGDFQKGNSISQTEKRTQARGMRRRVARFLLRRERLLRVLRLMGFLPAHYEGALDRYGHFAAGDEPKLAWRRDEEGKMQFLFKGAFEEMMADFRAQQPELVAGGLKVPYDWTIYFLRHKALTAPLSKEELAWVLMQFNQKRGYNKLRGEDESEESENKLEEYLELRVREVQEDSTGREGDDVWYKVYFEESDDVYPRKSKVPLYDLVGKVLKLVRTTQLNADGSVKRDKDGNPKRSYRAPKDDDWGLLKIKTEKALEAEHATIGEYIYQQLLKNPTQKVIGDLVRTVDRRFYKEELHSILQKQAEFIPELMDRELYGRCIEELYPTNEAYRNSIAGRDFVYLLADDILLYQRPLKSKKYLIENCPFEKRTHIDGRSGEKVQVPIKCIAKTHPLYQEFRLWQFVGNLRIYEAEGLGLEVTDSMLPAEKRVELFEWLNEQKSVKEEKLFKEFFGLKGEKAKRYRWNYVPGKDYPANETRAVMRGGLKKADIDAAFLTADKERALWHIMYSVDDMESYKKALRTFANKQGWKQEECEKFVGAFERLTLAKEKEYGAYSAKAVGKLLALMRQGKYWSAEAIDENTRSRIDHIVSGEADDRIAVRVRELFSPTRNAGDNDKKNRYPIHGIEDCRGMAVWQACYLVYDRHSETQDTKRWERPEDIDGWLAEFRHHSLNNPIVEQLVTETLRTVRDIWRQEGHIDEIHIEMGRELKKTAQERKEMTESIKANEATNQRIRILLAELMNPDCGVENVRPNSPSQQELLKIYEEGALRYKDEMGEDVRGSWEKLSTFDGKHKPTHGDVLKYKTWLDQKYCSPYTGKPIPLAKLFTEDYQIEHVIPQSVFFDDSFSNKVICEAAVNQEKGRMLGHEFISKRQGQKITCSMGRTVEILSVQAYEELVKRNFTGQKQRKLLMDEIPQEFVARQLNDSRYISRLMLGLLSKIVRPEVDGEVESEATSKRVIPTNGSITDRLKKDWGVGDQWNRIVLPRFQRLNDIQKTTEFTAITASGHEIPDVPLDMRQSFNKKRIDHRHHAMDAIVIACTTRSHVNLLNNANATEDGRSARYDLQKKLRTVKVYTGRDGKEHEAFGEFKKPWDTFPQDVYAVLRDMVVSFKQNLRVINKTANRYESYRDEQGNLHTNGVGQPVKRLTQQTKGDSWAIRKSLHKETFHGEVHLWLKEWVSVAKAIKEPKRIVDKDFKAFVLQKMAEKGIFWTNKQYVEYFEKHLAAHAAEYEEVNGEKVAVYYYTDDKQKHYYATRKALLDIFEGRKDPAAAEKTIESITDSGIRAILKAHLVEENGNVEQAFSPEGLERMNANIQRLNNGHQHQPIKRVRVFEEATKFAVGQTGNKVDKFVEAAHGTNLFFVIYEDAKGNRDYATVPLRTIINCQKQYEKEWRVHLEDHLKEGEEPIIPADARLRYVLSPGDLVYVPTKEEQVKKEMKVDNSRVYKVVSCSKKNLSCLLSNVAKPIVDKVEFESLNKMETTVDKEKSIKKFCVPVHVDRLGNIVSIDW